jgi:DNA-binding response OmpR family regulator
VTIRIGTNRIVLLVEDLPQLQQIIQKYLEDDGFDVIVKADYHGALGTLAECTPHLVCLDLTLPRESGFELCEYIRDQTHLSNVPILVISERSSPEDMAHAENVGANAFLKKPFTKEKLSKYVTTLLDGPHASRPSVRRLRRA